MRATIAAGVLAASLGLAPFQCASDPDESLRQEETAPEALWGLAERFHAEHDEPARVRTLHYLIDHYPSSRFAERGRILVSHFSQAPPAETTTETTPTRD